MDNEGRRPRNIKFEPCVRYTNGLRIYFKSTLTVQVSHNGAVINITRWDNLNRNVYTNCWQPFIEKLKRLNSLEDIWDVMDLAQKYELTMYSARDGEDRLPPGIKELPAKYVRRYRNGKEI